MPATDQILLSRAEFSCFAPDASSVFLVGKFDRCKTDLRPMTRNDGGDWSASLELPPGRYLYKFLIVYSGVLNMSEGRATVIARRDQWN